MESTYFGYEKSKSAERQALRDKLFETPGGHNLEIKYGRHSKNGCLSNIREALSSLAIYQPNVVKFHTNLLLIC